MITIKMAVHMGKWGIPGNSTKNVAQCKKLEVSMAILQKNIGKTRFWWILHNIALTLKLETDGCNAILALNS